MAVSSALAIWPIRNVSRLPQVGDVPLIIQQLLFKIFWELLAYRRPTPQRQPHPGHEPYGPSFTGFKTNSRNAQRSGLFYRLLVKWNITHKQSRLASLMKESEECIINFRKSSFLVSGEFLSWRLTPADRRLVFPPQSKVAFINSKNCSGFVVSLILCATNNLTFEICRIWYSLRFLASLFHNYGTRQIGTSSLFTGILSVEIITPSGVEERGISISA